MLQFARSRPLFLWVAFSLPAATIYAHSLAPGMSVFRGHDWGVLVGVLGVVLAVFLWIPYTSDSRVRGALARSILILLGAAWTWQILRTHTGGGVFNVTAFGVPIILALIWLKRVPRSGYVVAMMLLGLSLLLISGLSLILGAVGLTENGFAAVDSGPCRLPIFCDMLAVWPGADETLGVPARWGGPYGSVNLAAPVGGLVALIGFMAPSRPLGVLLVAGGVVVLMLGQARTSMVAFLIALLVLALWNQRVVSVRRGPAIRTVVLVCTIALGALLILALDPTLNGRTPIWSFYAHIWLKDWISGVGDVGVEDAVRDYASQVSFVLHDHAHSVLLDGTLRYGLPSLALGLAIYVLVIWAGAREARTASAVPLSLAVYVLVVGLADTVYSWAYWSAYVATMVFVATSIQDRSTKLHQSPSSGGST